uniref:Uncharacterized protein n=1 Tax=Oryza glumipatula TaxID=40148 RepID=A0A0E0A965_9ORYZ
MAGNVEQSAAALVWGYETGRRNGYCDQWRRRHSTVHCEQQLAADSVADEVLDFSSLSSIGTGGEGGACAVGVGSGEAVCEAEDEERRIITHRGRAT